MAKITVRPADSIFLEEKTYTVKDKSISDGYHTFDELYEHRARLFIALCVMIADDNYFIEQNLRDVVRQTSIIRSKLHHDGSGYAGYFILMINGDVPGEQISYNLPDKYWEACSFAQEVPTAPEWDGHTPDDVLERLFEFVSINSPK